MAGKRSARRSRPTLGRAYDAERLSTWEKFEAATGLKIDADRGACMSGFVHEILPLVRTYAAAGHERALFPTDALLRMLEWIAATEAHSR
jgi:hypothetical protein